MVTNGSVSATLRGDGRPCALAANDAVVVMACGIAQ
jgi:hypothetical protein